jgi:superfamily I DNA/RNA helicase
MPYDPTAEQTAILAHDHRHHARVLAGPGTGKSATLVALVDHLLTGNPAPRIKLLTFTRAATAELAKKVSDHPAAAAERPSTIHSFSISVLLRNPGTGEFPQPLRIADKFRKPDPRDGGQLGIPGTARAAASRPRRARPFRRRLE